MCPLATGGPKKPGLDRAKETVSGIKICITHVRKGLRFLSTLPYLLIVRKKGNSLSLSLVIDR